MLYSFSSETSQKSDTSATAPAARSSETDNEIPPADVEIISAAATTNARGGAAMSAERTAEQPVYSSAVGASQSGFDAYVYDNMSKAKAVASALGGGQSDEDDPTFFTPTELKMLLLNFENLSPEEQLNLTEYIRRHGGPGNPPTDTTSSVAAPTRRREEPVTWENTKSDSASIFSRYFFFVVRSHFIF